MLTAATTLKILAVNQLIDPVTGGGTAERTLQLAQHFAALGNECTILTLDCGMTNDLIDNIQRDRLKLFILPCLNRRFYIPKFRLSDIYSLVDNADIIHIMGHWTFLNVLVSYLARKLNKAYVVCPAGALPVFGRSRMIKQVYNVLGGRRTIRSASAHIAIANNEIDQFALYGLDSDRITTIPNGVNPLDYQACDVSAFRHNNGLGAAPYILFIGRLNPIKGPDLLLQAFHRIVHILPSYHLVFAGPDGGMEASLKAMSIETNLEGKVHFTGYIGGTDKVAAYQGASLIAVPSRQEAMSIVALEAGICGKPVLMTNQCGFDILEQLGGGLIVAATVEGIQDGLLNMLHESTRLEEMGARLKGHVEERYTWEIAAKTCIELFQDVLNPQNN